MLNRRDLLKHAALLPVAGMLPKPPTLNEQMAKLQLIYPPPPLKPVERALKTCVSQHTFNLPSYATRFGGVPMISVVIPDVYEGRSCYMWSPRPEQYKVVEDIPEYLTIKNLHVLSRLQLQQLEQFFVFVLQGLRDNAMTDRQFSTLVLHEDEDRHGELDEHQFVDCLKSVGLWDKIRQIQLSRSDHGTITA